MQQRWAIVGQYLSAGFIIGTWSSCMPDMKYAFHLTDNSLGWTLLLAGVACLFTAHPVGRAIDLYGWKKVLLITTVLGTVIKCFVPTLADMGVSAILAFTFDNLYVYSLNVVVTYLATHVEQDLGQDIMSSIHAGFSAGTMLAAFGCSALYYVTDWRFTYPAMAVLAAVVRLIAWPQLDDIIEPIKTSSSRDCVNDLGFTNRSLSDILYHSESLHSATRPRVTRSVDAILLRQSSQEPLVRIDSRLSQELSNASQSVVKCSKAQGYYLILIASLVQFVDGCVGDWGGLLVVACFGRDLRKAPLVYAAYCIATLLGRMHGPRLKTYFGRNKVLLGGNIVACVFLTIMVLLPTLLNEGNDSIPSQYVFAMMLVASFASGYAWANTYPISQTWLGCSDELSTTEGASLLCLYGTIADMGAPGLMGGLSKVSGIRFAFGVPVLAIGVAIILTWRVILLDELNCGDDSLKEPADLEAGEAGGLKTKNYKLPMIGAKCGACSSVLAKGCSDSIVQERANATSSSTREVSRSLTNLTNSTPVPAVLRSGSERVAFN